MAGHPLKIHPPGPFPKSRRLKPEELPQVYQSLLDHFGHQGWWPGDTPFEMMVGAILTQNTAWINVEKAIANLKSAGALTPLKIKNLQPEKLAALIRPSGYFRVKAKRLKIFVDFLFLEYGGDLKKMFREDGHMLREKLLQVKGIGPETADSILLYAAQKPFFVIDAYTKRIFSRHRISKSAAPWNYANWQQLFMKALPADVSLYNDFHAQIVKLAKSYCKSNKISCDLCPLEPYL